MPQVPVAGFEGRREVRVVPVDQLREELSAGQNRLGDVLTQLGQFYETDAVEAALLQLLREGEVEVFPIGEHVAVRLVGEGGARRAEAGPGD